MPMLAQQALPENNLHADLIELFAFTPPHLQDL